MGHVRLTKRIEFSASHRYHNPQWDEARNRTVFGVCNLPAGHGHNYLLDVTIRGAVSPDTGMVVNLFDLKQILLQVLIEFDHKHLNLDTPYFKHIIPTTENIATVLWSLLATRPEIGALDTVRLFEEDDLYAEVNQDLIDKGGAFITRGYHFSSAHRARAGHVSEVENQRLFGACHSASLHGHNYDLSVTVGGPIDPESGMVTDITALDNLVRDQVLARFDGRNLNEDPLFSKAASTGENLSRAIWALLASRVTAGQLEKVGISETSDRLFEYCGEQSEPGRQLFNK
jgi:6-pyruvoyltetrahydropterin/6-carboxytetrahydropterin synthase